jgi:hypothetical protein
MGWSTSALAARGRALKAKWRVLNPTNKVVLIAALIGALGTLASPVVTRLVEKSSGLPGFKGVEVVRAIPLDQATIGGPPDSVDQVLDIQLRNTGAEVQVLKEVSLTVITAAPILCGQYNATGLPVSGKYDIKLPADPPSEGYRVSVPTSQTISSGEADHIQLRVSLAANGEAPHLLYAVKAHLLFNGGTKDVLTTNTVILPFIREVDIGLARYCPQATAIRKVLEATPDLSGTGQSLLEALQ